MPEETENPFVKTALPAVRKVDGVSLQGDFPLNSRLRAEALAKAGIERDPEALVTAEAIKSAGERMERLASAAQEAEGRIAKVEEARASGEPVDEDTHLQFVADRQAVRLAASSSGEAPPELADMKRDELVALAEREGIDLSTARTNADRVAAIEAARASTSAPPPVSDASTSTSSASTASEPGA